MSTMTFTPAKVIAPVRTLHGTNPESLVEGYCDARALVQDAMENMSNVEFNGRDYADPQTFQAAKEERRANLQKLQDVMDYLEAMAIVCGKLRG